MAKFEIMGANSSYKTMSEIKFGDGKSITFRHNNDLDNFVYQSKLMQFAVLAMREIGEKLITEERTAKNQKIPLSVISEGMGNDSATTTQIYLASLDNSAIDKANRSILKKI